MSVHLLRNSFGYAARQDWEKIAKSLRPVYTAPTEEAALERFVEFTDAWGGKYPAIVRLWEKAWAEFVPFLQFDVEIRKIVCTTNAIESINARIRKAVRARGHFPTDQAALKCVYLAVMTRAACRSVTFAAVTSTIRMRPMLSVMTCRRLPLIFLPPS